MNEKKFAEILRINLQKSLRNYRISSGESLIYKVIIDSSGKFCPKNPNFPKRGQLALETDILIKKDNTPLVVIETKIEGFSTHDILTYSTKALKHKEIYPYLRYGLVVGNTEIIGNKFFTHNHGFDFAIAIPEIKNLKIFMTVIREQVTSAELLLNILKDKHQTRVYSSSVTIKNN